ncbi:hypothetical protein ABNX05_11315 [Lysinibacillus sp. M3]|uniref:Uncharacterized protein n=1 Tax=Lysinibacillus zambalensis TaxID=3160866 RepID=A0ABV1MRS1_9BACI
MKTVQNKKLLEQADSYVQDGVLIKWRWYNDNHESMEYKLAMKHENESKLTNEDYEYMKSRGNMVIEVDRKV